MNRNKTIVLIISFFIIILLALSTFLCIKKLSNKQEEYIYKIHLFEDYIPGYNYDIYVYDNYDILVVSQQGCSTVECIEGTVAMPKEEKNVIFSKKGKEILKKYFEDLFKKEETNFIKLLSSQLNNYDSTIIRSIISNNESLLNNIDLEKSYTYKMSYTNNLYYYDIYVYDDEIKVSKTTNCDGCNRDNQNYKLNFSEDNMITIREFIDNLFSDIRSYELDLNEISLIDNEYNIINAIISNDETYLNNKYLFKIQNDSCNCIPNTAYFYSDGTYEVNAAWNEIIQKGKYQSDPELLINELKDNGNDSDDERGMDYYIELYNGDKYWIRHENKIIKEFLKDLDITWY